jgi:hypothetical protein
VTAPGLDERQHAAALKAAIKARLAPGDEVYEYGDVPGLDGNAGIEPDLYVLLQIERRYLPAAHSPREATRTAWRATIRSVGTTVNECRWVSLKVAQALDSVRLTIGGIESTRIQHETTDAPEPRNGRADSLSRWTYSL